MSGKKTIVCPWAWVLWALTLPIPSAASDNADFGLCKTTVIGILAGNETLGDIDNITIFQRGYIYTGPIYGLHSEYPREDILTITYDGKIHILGLHTYLTSSLT